MRILAKRTKSLITGILCLLMMISVAGCGETDQETTGWIPPSTTAPSKNYASKEFVMEFIAEYFDGCEYTTVKKMLVDNAIAFSAWNGRARIVSSADNRLTFECVQAGSFGVSKKVKVDTTKPIRIKLSADYDTNLFKVHINAFESGGKSLTAKVVSVGTREYELDVSASTTAEIVLIISATGTEGNIGQPITISAVNVWQEEQKFAVVAGMDEEDLENVVHPADNPNIISVNHRGYSVEAPENTLPAYILSKQKGFTYVECDVAFTADGVAVLLHDSTVDRTSNGTGNIAQMTYEEVYKLDFGSWKSEAYAGTKIPTFREFILLCKNIGLHPYIELKSGTQAQIESIVQDVKACGMQGKVTYISESVNVLKWVKNRDGCARLGLVCSQINQTLIVNATSLRTGENQVFLNAAYSCISEDTVNLCCNADIPLEVWTINWESWFDTMPAYISGVTSDSLVASKVLYDKFIP